MEVFYPDWLANPVLVLKKNNTWRMCIDNTSLNKACPKDPFALLRIYQVIDSTTGCDLLSFLDAYSGYHQIPLYQPDQIKTSFITPYVKVATGTGMAGDDSIVPAPTPANPHPRQSPISYRGGETSPIPANGRHPTPTGYPRGRRRSFLPANTLLLADSEVQVASSSLPTRRSRRRAPPC
jgi:hypothetical protein